MYTMTLSISALCMCWASALTKKHEYATVFIQTFFKVEAGHYFWIKGNFPFLGSILYRQKGKNWNINYYEHNWQCLNFFLKSNNLGRDHIYISVHIFWEGHKILRNLHLNFVLCSIVPVKSKVKISQYFVAFSEYMNFIQGVPT